METLFIIMGLGYLALPLLALVLAIQAKNRARDVRREMVQYQEWQLAEQDKVLRQIQALQAELAQLRQQAPADAAGLSRLAGLEQALNSARDNLQAKQAPVHTAAEPDVPDLAPLPELPHLAPLPQTTAQPEPRSVTVPAQVIRNTKTVVGMPSVSVEAAIPAAAATAQETTGTAAAETATEAANEAIKEAVQEAAAAPGKEQSKAAPPPQAPSKPGLLDMARDWLLGGNLVAKIGLLILFFGVAFLLKYASERVTIPIELRLAAVVVADIGFLLWGWRIRLQRPGIALPVQGASLAIMMLVTFAAMRMYQLIPPTLAFFLLFALTAFTCLLAILQNAFWLALFGISGGFLAPVLTSTGGGSHIGLFSYYLLLNAGILAIALKRAWRALNLAGFVFTFVIATTWGVLRYQDENYLSCQLFLLAFFLFYVVIAVLYALREVQNLKGVVDATLVFGTPVFGFGLQYALVQDKPFGLAISALCLGLMYGTLSLSLLRRLGKEQRLLVESFLALTMIFGTLAIPLALDGRWTSAAWALEGAGIVWIGLRQQRRLTWCFGLLVQFGAWVSYLLSLSHIQSGRAVHENLWLGFLLLAGSAFLMAWQFRSNAQNAEHEDKFTRGAGGVLATLLLAVASIWLMAGAWTEIFLRTDGVMLANLLVISALGIALLLGWLAARQDWAIARWFALVLQVVAGCTVLVLLLDASWPDFGHAAPLFQTSFLSSLMLALGAAASSYVLQSLQTPQIKGRNWLPGMLLFGAVFWWFGFSLHGLAQGLLYWLPEQGAFMAAEEDDRFFTIYVILISLSCMGLAWLARRLQWDSLRQTAIVHWLLHGLLALGLFMEMNLDGRMPPNVAWVAILCLWLGNEFLQSFWDKQAWELKPWGRKYLHLLRSASPWLMIWPVGHYWLQRWLNIPAMAENAEQAALLEQAGWFSSGAWSRFLPAWAMMAVLGWLLLRALQAGKQGTGVWPLAPLRLWYLQRLLAAGVIWSVLLVIVWNFTQNGAMAPLPYLPLLNPLDLSTAFAILLCIVWLRVRAQVLGADSGVNSGKLHSMQAWLARSFPPARRQTALLAVLFIWFNLVVLRSLAHYCQIDYRFDAMFDSQLVQAAMSLVWSVAALLVMRRGAKRGLREDWLLGAALLGLVVLKLFMVDLSNVGGIERIVSFLGVGVLMVVIGYLAPFPGSKAESVQKKEE